MDIDRRAVISDLISLMPVFSHLPLGQPIPPSVHGVSCSLPTMRAVIGYEEKDPEIMRSLSSGYPRFVQHPFLRQASAHVLRTLKMGGYQAWLTSSEKASRALVRWLAPTPARVIAYERLTGVAFPENVETYGRAKTFLQHTGAFLSSREAEDYLLRVGELSVLQAETTFEGYAASRVKGVLTRAFLHAAVEDVVLANSGMNAIYAAFRILSDIQRARSRTVWVQLGWLYLDTIAVLQKFTDRPVQDYIFQNDVCDLPAIQRLFADRGHEIAGIITEAPTNPLLQTANLPAIYELCRSYGAALIVDPSIVSALNIDVLRYTDVAVTSLTKYTASDGDVIMGAAVVNPQSIYAADLRQRLPAELEPVYSRDLSRLAAQIGDFEAVVAQINRSAPVVIEFLRQHPRVTSVYWPQQPASRENYLRLARSPDAFGGMISFTVAGPLANFYDRLRMPKGPSFGMKTSLICPFIYLAHYDLVTSEDGRNFLRANGLDPELLRLCLGCEPVEAIVESLAEALEP